MSKILLKSTAASQVLTFFSLGLGIWELVRHTRPHRDLFKIRALGLCSKL